jgi:hypothetical protein
MNTATIGNAQVKYEPLLVVLILAIVLSCVIEVINKNTVRFEGLADEQRYADAINKGVDERPLLHLLAPLLWTNNFAWSVNFLIYLILGYTIYSYSKNWVLTLIVLLGFSTTLITTFNLFAQAMVFLPGIYFWLFVPVQKRWQDDSTKWLGFLIFATFTHQFGFLFVVGMYFAKRIGGDETKRMQWAFIFLYVVAMLVLALSDRTLRLTFFYPTILPFDLGSINTYFWIVFISAPVAYLFSKTTNQSALAFAGIIMFAAIGNQLGGSGLEIDFWRFLIFFEWIALIEIWKARAELGRLFQWIIIPFIFGVVRVGVGLIKV